MPKAGDTLTLFFRRLPQAAAALVFFIGCLVLAGWVFHIPLLKSMLPGLVEMKANTAIGFILSGAALWLLQRNDIAWRTRRIAKACAGIIGILGLLTLIEYLFGWNIGIDQLLFREAPGAMGTSNPGRMAFPAALDFLLLGAALLLLGGRFRKLVQWLAIAAMLCCLPALFGYLFDAPRLASSGFYTPMALHTAIGFLALSLGLVFARPDRGIAAIITSDGPSGAMARRLLPAGIALFIALGWLRLWGEKAGMYGAEFGTGLYTIVVLVIFFCLVMHTGLLLLQSEQERKRLKDDRDRLFNLPLDMVCIAGFDGYFKQINSAWEKTLGFTREEILAKPYLEFIHPDDRPVTATEAEKNASGTDTFHFENRYLCKDGSYRWLLWNALPDTKRQLIYAAARDITDRKQSEEKNKKFNQELEWQKNQLTSANKELEAFSYSVSHDLRAPLRSINGFAQILKDEYAPRLDDEGRRLLDVVTQSAKTMGKLIDDLLAFARLGLQEISRKDIDIAALVKKIFEEIQAGKNSTNIRLDIQEIPPAHGDPALMRQVLFNLLSNAVKFTGDKKDGIIEVGGKAWPEYNTYYIKDNGAGFDMQHAGKLFQAFQRLHSAKEYAGTGIGLAIVQRVIQRHGGKVWAEAKVNEGAVFHFMLPKAGAALPH